MSSIRSILEQHFYQDGNVLRPDGNKSVINQALKEIEEAIDGAKPEIPVADSWQRGIEKSAFEDAIRVYQYKIKELLK